MNELVCKFKKILDCEKIAYIATTNNKYVDNSTICFSCDENLNIYFGSYSDTLKCKNIEGNPHVAIAVSTLQIHGVVRKIFYGSEEYKNKIKNYNLKFPQYAHVFEKEHNELYEIKPLVIWNYNPSKGEMNRDKVIFDMEYYKKLSPYEAPKEFKNRKKKCF